jgi:NAD-dependent DNA ligase
MAKAKATKVAAGVASPANKKFLFTGKLASMTRSQAASYVDAAGGKNAGSVSKDLDYLVIGDDGSFLYGAGTKGEKTLAAEKLIASGAALKIISETQFLEMVKAPPPAEPARPKIKTGPVKETVAPDGEAFDPVGKKFMFTGKLSSMSRTQANAKVASIGGVNAGSVSKDLDFLVVGDDGSPLFGGGAKGDKILKAEKLIAQGLPLKILAESAFMAMADGAVVAGAKKRKQKR